MHSMTDDAYKFGPRLCHRDRSARNLALAKLGEPTHSPNNPHTAATVRFVNDRSW
jgi:hypothetical protein